MLPRTIYISEPAYLRLQHKQLLIHFAQKDEKLSSPLDDLGYLILDHPQITLSQPLLSDLSKANVALIVCDEKHLPHGLMLPIHSHHLSGERFAYQLNASLPLKKQLWKYTIRMKIHNQSLLLGYQGDTDGHQKLKKMSQQVLSGDQTYIEGQAARYYWRALFGKNFVRDPQNLQEDPVNTRLNYGYTILRSGIARALLGSGLLPLTGIQHHNRYNAYPLADDIMEPYRPFVDQLILQMKRFTNDHRPLTSVHKKQCLQLPYLVCPSAQGNTSLATMWETTTASLAVAFVEQKAKLLTYPTLPCYGNS